MKFVSLFSPVTLPNDPVTGNEGEIYFNSSSSVLRLVSQGIWVNLLDENNHLQHTGNIIKILGDASTISFDIVIDESFDNSTVYALSASASIISLGDHQNYPYRIGTSLKVVRAGDGAITIEPHTASVTITTPSNNYLTFKGDSINIINIGEDSWILDGPFRDIY